jgi:hypothetical protein
MKTVTTQLRHTIPAKSVSCIRVATQPTVNGTQIINWNERDYSLATREPGI